jgi:hypothetical protein
MDTVQPITPEKPPLRAERTSRAEIRPRKPKIYRAIFIVVNPSSAIIIFL